MKSDDLPFDETCDSLANAAGRIGVPVEVLKAAKRAGSSAFRGSRVNLTRLREEIAAAAKEPLSDILLSVVKEVARIVANKLPHGDARLRTDSGKLTQAIHNGFGCALCILEPDSADEFLSKSAVLMESIFKSTRKGRHESRNGATKR